MPYVPHNRITLSGIFGALAAPVEEWSWSFATAPSTSGEPGAMIALATEVMSLYGTHMAPMFGPNVVLTRTRAAAINESGHVPQTADGQYLQGDNVTTKVGTGSQVGQPILQQALAVSLVTPRAGASGKGRFFLPATVHPVGTGYTLASTNTQAVATAAAAFLSGVANSNAFVGGILVCSYKGFASPVTGVRVGSVPDTMRSRRGRLTEIYATGVVTG